MATTESGGTHSTAAAFADLVGELYATPDLGMLLGRAVEFTRGTITCDCAGIVLLAGHGLQHRLVTASDSRVVEADRLRQVLGDGPDDAPLGTELIRDTAAETRWPQWAPRIAELGLRSMLQAGLPGRPQVRGSLTAYATQPDAFTPLDLALTELLAVHVALAVTAAMTTNSLKRAVEARTEVGQAVGILMERFTIDADEAFARLRRYSQRHNLRLRTVTAELLTERRRYSMSGNDLVRRSTVRPVDNAAPGRQAEPATSWPDLPVG
jgi:GAF domain-containing protein